MRKCKKSKAKMPKIGHKGCVKKGIKIIFNETDIGDNKKVMFGSSVGKKKRREIMEKFKGVVFV
jgi:ribosomal protein L32E